GCTGTGGHYELPSTAKESLWARSSRSAASACPRRSTASCSAKPACSAGSWASEPSPPSASRVGGGWSFRAQDDRIRHIERVRVAARSLSLYVHPEIVCCR